MGVKILNDRNSFKDVAGRQALNSLFGEAIYGIRTPSISEQFVYGFDPDGANIEQINGGTISVIDNLLTGSTGTATNGTASVETKSYVRYIPGYDTFCYFTAVFSEPKLNSYQRIGLFDVNDGYCIGYEEDGNFYFTRRKNGESFKYQINPQSINFGDGEKLNTSKGNVYRINYAYLGFANAIIEVLNPNGGWELLYNVKYPNKEIGTHIGNTYLPIRGEVGNTGNNTNITIGSGSVCAGIIDGSGIDVTSRFQLFDNGVVTISGGVTNIVTFRNLTTFTSKLNKVSARLGDVIVATDLNKVAKLSLVKNATITNTPTWNDVNTDKSILEYSTDTTITVGTGIQLIKQPLSKAGLFDKNYDINNFQLYPGETATFYIETNGSGDFSFAINWKELF